MFPPRRLGNPEIDQERTRTKETTHLCLLLRPALRQQLHVPPPGVQKAPSFLGGSATAWSLLFGALIIQPGEAAAATCSRSRVVV